MPITHSFSVNYPPVLTCNFEINARKSMWIWARTFFFVWTQVLYLYPWKLGRGKEPECSNAN